MMNIDQESRDLLELLKRDYGFESDDHIIRFLAREFVSSSFANSLKQYLEYRKQKEQEG